MLGIDVIPIVPVGMKTKAPMNRPAEACPAEIISAIVDSEREEKLLVHPIHINFVRFVFQLASG